MVVRKDKIASGYNGNLESLVIKNSKNELVEVPNGVFATVTNKLYQKDGFFSGEAFEGVLAGSADAETADVLLVDGKHYEYDERIQKDDYKYRKGEVARGYRLTSGDIISLTEDLLVIGGTPEAKELPAIGEVWAVHTDGKLGKHVPSVEGAKPVVSFVVIEACGRELTHRNDAWAFQVVR